MTFQGSSELARIRWSHRVLAKEPEFRQDVSPAGGRSTKENRDSIHMRGEINRTPRCRTKLIE